MAEDRKANQRNQTGTGTGANARSAGGGPSVAEGATGVTGAVAGAALGSAAGPLGTVVGALAGGLGGAAMADGAQNETGSQSNRHRNQDGGLQGGRNQTGPNQNES